MTASSFRLTCFFLLLCGSLWGQSYVVSGRVVNNADLPVAKASVLMDNKYVTTNSNGEFHIRTSVLPNVMAVKHQRYGEKEQLVNLPPVGEDTVFVTIVLPEKGTDLEEFTVTSSRVIWAYPKVHVHVIDFDLRGDHMLLLCKDDNDYFLRYVDALSEPLFDLPIRRHPKRFYRDCSGEIHVMYNDSIFPVRFTGDSLSLLTGQTNDQAKETLDPCALSFRNKQVFQYGGNSNQSVDYVLIDTLAHRVVRLYQAKSRKYMRAVAEFEREKAIEMRELAKEHMDNSVDHQLEVQQVIERQQLYQSLLMRQIYAPVFRLRDSIVIFDHLNDTAVVFHSSGRLVRSYPIIYQHHPKWDYELIVNEEGTRVFARYNYRGMAHLMEINPTDGTVIREVPLEKHIYPGKLQIQGNFIYYIYHHYIDYSINYVYKQRIE